jgi:hypothetical protein
MADESAKSKGKPPNCTTFVVQFVPGLLTTLLSSENTPGIDYGALAKIQNPWRRRRTLPEGVYIDEFGRTWIPVQTGTVSTGPRTKLVNSGSPRPVFFFACVGQPDQIVNL